MGEQYDGYWQESLSEESRQMIHDASFKAWKQFFDDLDLTPHQKRRNHRHELGKRVRLIAADLELSGQSADARILMLAAQDLMRDE